MAVVRGIGPEQRTLHRRELLIATTALHHGATLVTDDRALLAGDIPGLSVENWI